MPDYLPTHRGVTRSQALIEASVVATITRAMLSTFELWHPSFDEPIYVVNDGQDFLGFKESTADREPNQGVTFMAAPLKLQRPEESDTAEAPEITISLAGVQGVTAIALRKARGSLDPWEVIERVYASDDPSGPAILPPQRLLVSKITITDEGAAFTASYGDPVNVSVPRITFQRAQYPALLP